MCSLLNVSNASDKPEKFNFKDIEVLADNKDQNWFKREHIGQDLGIARIITSTSKLLEEGKRSRAFPQTEGGIRIMDPLREDAQDHDIFIPLTGALYVTVNSRKDKDKALKKHILKDIAPRGFDAKIEDPTDHVQALEVKNEEKRQAHQQAIEEKEATIALLNDDLKNREHDNMALQAQRDMYK